MKLLPALAFTLLVSAGLQAAPPTPEVLQFLQEGQAAFSKGDYAKAKGSFEMVYQIDPRNVTAINYLNKIKVLDKGAPKGPGPEQQLATLTVPKVSLKDATLGAVFDYLRITANKLSDGKVPANFVLKLPEEQVKTQTVTLNLTNAPFTEVVKYVAELSNVAVEYQRYAIVVTPKSAPPVAAPTTVPAQ